MKYIDTSAFVKYYSVEEYEKGASTISQLIEEAKSGKVQLLSSLFIIGEVVSVFDKWYRINIITPREFDGILKRFFVDIKNLSDTGALILEPLNSLMIVSCTELIIKHHLTINDALHLYAAITNKDVLEQFVCSDKALLKAAKAEGFKISNPEKS